MQEKILDRDAARRRAILDAARDCILKFGYAKSSLEDIAKQAAVSRPLIYRKFKSKEEIFGALLEDLFETQYRAAEHALAKPGSGREKGANRGCSDGHGILWGMQSSHAGH